MGSGKLILKDSYLMKHSNVSLQSGLKALADSCDTNFSCAFLSALITPMKFAKAGFHLLYSLFFVLKPITLQK